MARNGEQKTNIQLRQLNFLIGKWHTEGTIKKTSASPAISIKGMDSYEWICAGAFILHSADVFMGDIRTEVIEIIGYDANRKCFFMQSFDNNRNCTMMHSSLPKKGVLKITDPAMRSTLTAGKNGKSMIACWEQLAGGTKWKPWMNIKFTK